MPINIPDDLPAKDILHRENVFVMGDHKAIHQDIRPLKIVILNLMPIKETTETQLLRLLSNSPLQVDVSLMRIKNHESKNTSQEHLNAFYNTFDDVSDRYFDGMIITGAPIEHLAFEEVHYWTELQGIMNWKLEHVTSTLHICWGAQAALYHHFSIAKYPLAAKMFGVFQHHLVNDSPLVRGFDEQFAVPHSRHTGIRRADVEAISELTILAESAEAGVYLLATRDGKQIFVTGHAEYDRDTLKAEYERDMARGIDVTMPRHYFLNDNTSGLAQMTWRAHAHLLFSNWLNYYVYQETPYEWLTCQRACGNSSKRSEAKQSQGL